MKSGFQSINIFRKRRGFEVVWSNVLNFRFPEMTVAI